jgi:hypothetical protein
MTSVIIGCLANQFLRSAEQCLHLLAHFLTSSLHFGHKIVLSDIA